jgi:DNA-binding GntR family transcriptional regulator
MELTRLKRERAVDAVHQALRQAILNSHMKPGERLNVEDLAGKLGVSLTPVRHAIQLLEAEGLIVVRPRSGTFVASLSARDIEETFDIRCALECLAADKAVDRITAEDLRKLKALLKSMRRPVRNDEDRKAHEDRNAELHLTILRAAGNQRLLDIYQELNANIKIARIHASDADWLSRLKQEQEEHEEIVDALEKRNRTSLERAMRRHIMRARDSLLAAVQRIDGQPQ